METGNSFMSTRVDQKLSALLRRRAAPSRKKLKVKTVSQFVELQI